MVSSRKTRMLSFTIKIAGFSWLRAKFDWEKPIQISAKFMTGTFIPFLSLLFGSNTPGKNVLCEISWTSHTQRK